MLGRQAIAKGLTAKTFAFNFEIFSNSRANIATDSTESASKSSNGNTLSSQFHGDVVKTAKARQHHHDDHDNISVFGSDHDDEEVSYQEPSEVQLKLEDDLIMQIFLGNETLIYNSYDSYF